MKSFRHAFTMIELIFVIVVIGILASVAMVTLAATRDDAMVTRGVSNVKQVVRDLGSYYIARGEFGLWEEMTNVKLLYPGPGNPWTNKYEAENQTCILFTRAPRENPDRIVVIINPMGYRESTVCKGISDELIKQGFAAMNPGIPHVFGGKLTN